MKRWFLPFVPASATTGMGFCFSTVTDLTTSCGGSAAVEYVESVPAGVRLSVSSTYDLSEIKTYS